MLTRCRCYRVRTYFAGIAYHRVENLEPVCSDCHKIINKLERSK
jgi:hypothetical protein